MNLLSISGGSTKISGLAGAADVLINKLHYKPDYIVGTSAGSILALPIALGKWKMIRRETVSFTLDKIFSIKPVTESGKIALRAKLRVMLGNNSLGEQLALVETIAELISCTEFNNYAFDPNSIPIYIGCVDYRSGARRYINIKELSYEGYLMCTLASTSIPYATSPVIIGDDILYDGGARDHIGSHWMMENIKGITENVSIYSRPQDLSNYLDTTWEPGNILDVFDRDQAIRNIETSKKDEKIERLTASELGIKNSAIFLPKVLTSLYDTDSIRVAELYRKGELATIKYYK